jgi:hypothetical protein
MGEANALAAAVRGRLGGDPLDMFVFPLSAVKPPDSANDDLARWRARAVLEVFGRQSAVSSTAFVAPRRSERRR